MARLDYVYRPQRSRGIQVHGGRGSMHPITSPQMSRGGQRLGESHLQRIRRRIMFELRLSDLGVTIT